eukprot:7909768-Pyramimonas_sp.AAC.1
MALDAFSAGIISQSIMAWRAGAFFLKDQEILTERTPDSQSKATLGYGGGDSISNATAPA